MTFNLDNVMGIATSIPEMVGEWLAVDILTETYDFVLRDKVQSVVKIMTKNPKDIEVISSYVPAGKQLMISGSYMGWQNPDGTLAYCIVPSLIKLGINGNIDFLGISFAEGNFFGRVAGAYTMLGTDLIHFNLLCEHVEKSEAGYTESETHVPIVLEANDSNVNFASRFIEDDRQLRVVANFTAWEGGHAFKCRRPDLGMKPRGE